MTEKTYRQLLDEAFDRDRKRLVPPSETKVSRRQYEKVLAVEFALTAARDVTKQLDSEARQLEHGSAEYLGYTFASKRMKAAWGKMNGEPPRTYAAIRDRTLDLLEELSAPLAIEREMAVTVDPGILNATTEDFGAILDFLKSQIS